jgi:hypothetical protein
MRAGRHGRGAIYCVRCSEPRHRRLSEAADEELLAGGSLDPFAA